MNTIILEGIKHAERRLNEIPHRYKDTDFKLISEASKYAEEMLKCKSKRRQGLLSEVLQLRKGLSQMRDIYQEKRSDVSEMCDKILHGQEPKKEDSEHRYTCWTYKGESFEYDSLTTLVSVKGKDSRFFEEIDDIQYKDS